MDVVREDAKSDWMRLVKKHKRRQKGLPALSNLNTNAGNVEKSIELFNAMQPQGNITIDASSGNVSSDGGVCESVDETNKVNSIVLSYENIPIEVPKKNSRPSGYYSSRMGQWYPDDDTTELLVDWDYTITPQEAIEFLQDEEEVLIELGIQHDLPDETFSKIIEKHLSHLVNKFNDKLKNYFYDYAVSDAQENYDYEYDYYEDDGSDYDPYDESLKSLDDKFDMSTRTLL